MLLWQVAKIAELDISGLPGDPGAFQYLLVASYEFECFIFRRGFLDQARVLARTDRQRRAIERADRAILRDSWADLAARAARLTAERESIAATIDQSGKSYTKCVCGYLPEFEPAVQDTKELAAEFLHPVSSISQLRVPTPLSRLPGLV